MKVLYFHQHFTTPDGSGGTRSYEFARALLARGHQVTMVCGQNDRGGLQLPFDPRRNWSRGEIAGIDVIALPLPYSNRHGLLRRTELFLRFAWRSALLALTEDYDLLFATSTPLTAGIPGIVMKLTGRGKKFVFEVRDLWPELPQALGMKNPLLLGGMSVLEWLSYRMADACVGLSPGIVEGVKRRSRPGLRVAIIPNGCDLDVFRPGRREDLRIEGTAAGDFVAVFTGAHGVANGLDAVLDAAAELGRRCRQHIKLVLIGDGREKERLMARAKAEQLTNCIFLPPIKKTEVARVTGSVDCGLMILANVPAFYFGTSPNKFFDYIAAGVPVLTNYPGWLAGMIQQQQCGMVVPPESAAEFANALEHLAGLSQEERRRMGMQGRALAETEFSREKLAGAWVQFLEETAAQA
jgi:glycosyltransferase involved in cell wall biosynthesis